MNLPPINVPASIWHDRIPGSPALVEGDADELAFNVVPGKNANGATVVLAARYFFGEPLLGDYGGQLPAPIWVVAVDAEHGVVYQEALLLEKSPPVVVFSREGAPPPPAGSFQGGAFAVDLCDHLRLPAKAARYHVFMWLDHVVTAVHEVDVPENARRTLLLQSHRQPADAIVFERTEPARVAAGPAARGALATGLTLSAVGVTKDGGNEHDLVRGALALGSRLAPPKSPAWLIVLAYNQRDRSFGWASVDRRAPLIEPGAIEHATLELDPSRFRFDVVRVAGERGAQRQRTFALAFADGHLSNVLTLPPR